MESMNALRKLLEALAEQPPAAPPASAQWDCWPLGGVNSIEAAQRIRDVVAEIERHASARDFEAALSIKDELYRAVLQAIADSPFPGMIEARMLAQEALKGEDIHARP